jgi:hypothetical protein
MSTYHSRPHILIIAGNRYAECLTLTGRTLSVLDSHPELARPAETVIQEYINQMRANAVEDLGRAATLQSELNDLLSA